MSVVAAAVIGQTVVGAYGAKKGADAAERAGDQQTALGYEQLDFEKKQAGIRRGDYIEERDYQRNVFETDRSRWNEIYGDVEENLSDFYSNLTPETFAAAGIEHQVKEFEQAKQRVAQTIAQRNIDGSGVGLSIDKQSEFALAENKANIRHDAPLKVAEAKQGFVAASGGKPTNAPNAGVGPTAPGVSNALSNMGNIAGNQAQRGYNLMDSAAGMIGSGLELGIKHWPQGGGGSGGGGLPGNTWTMANPSAAAGDVAGLA